MTQQSDVHDWLCGEINAGRLTPSVDESELTTIVGVLMRADGAILKKKPTAAAKPAATVKKKRA